MKASANFVADLPMPACYSADSLNLKLSLPIYLIDLITHLPSLSTPKGSVNDLI